MVDAIVSTILEQLISLAAKEITQHVMLVTGVEKEVKSLTSHLQAIQAVLNDAEEKQVKDKAVRRWLGRLNYASYDIEDVLDEWITARRQLQIEGGIDDKAYFVCHQKKKNKVCFCFPVSCFGLKQVFLRHDIAVKIKEINEELHDIAAQKDMFDLVKSGNKSSERPRRVQSTSLIDEEEICGRVGERNELLSKMLCESSDQQKGLHIISIVGMGGIGKTTLAQLASNHVEVKREFHKILWACVSETFDEFRIAKAMLEALTGSTSNLDALQSLLISYLSAQQDEEMETIGEEYFGILASRSFFQEFEKSYDNRIIECKMHDMVHDFAQFVSENECFSLEINGGEELNVTNSLDKKDIVQLSETLCELYILEKLDISYCMDLEELPEGIKKLINMRHLLNDGTDTLRYMVVGIGRLTGLRTLGEFHVSGGGGVDGRKACRLESLKNLEHLQVCGIRRLGDVSDVGEAKRLELDKKKYLSYLRLEFDKKKEGEETRKNEDDQLLLEALRPPLDLKKLEIRYYRGNTVFPNWMMSLTNLRCLDLYWCRNCEQLPLLGKCRPLKSSTYGA
ncbi:hypothetical protein KPL71_021416 [Citrus sinensis]|uniref:Uncharacterized protein n=1 Tax=Citrus sinensis TaxID=2711 RepID=A0ACB8JFC9_CITSI|nr:hypothetical protein KPL71_021416 [Citrus sinensis]